VKTSVDDQSKSSIRFAIESFKKEAETGTNYPRECCRILHDLELLTYNYVSSTKQAHLYHKNLVEHADHGPQIDGNSNRVTDLRTSWMPFVMGDADYEEIMTWLRNDVPRRNI
jgi:hypothetical protein